MAFDPASTSDRAAGTVRQALAPAAQTARRRIAEDRSEVGFRSILSASSERPAAPVPEAATSAPREADAMAAQRAQSPRTHAAASPAERPREGARPDAPAAKQAGASAGADRRGAVPSPASAPDRAQARAAAGTAPGEASADARSDAAPDAAAGVAADATADAVADGAADASGAKADRALAAQDAPAQTAGASAAALALHAEMSGPAVQRQEAGGAAASAAARGSVAGYRDIFDRMQQALSPAGDAGAVTAAQGTTARLAQAAGRDAATNAFAGDASTGAADAGQATAAGAPARAAGGRIALAGMEALRPGESANLPAALQRTLADLASGGFGAGGEMGAQGRGGHRREGEDVSSAAGLSGALPAIGFGASAHGGGGFGVQLAAAPDASGTASAYAGAADAADPLAAQASYWIGQKTQKAELTLDAFGGPVAVQIALTGGEAQVSFRSDQAEARAQLGQALPELREALQREGLVLSSVTVDTAAGREASASMQQQAGQGGRQDDGTAGDGPGRRGRQTVVAAGGAGPAAGTAAAAGAARGRLDLFV
jgi:flagellar hook-length control protein FliK